jgi:non-specific serine/threonine protein kinase
VTQPPCIGPYKILSELGHGGMGVVFLAEDPKLKRQVALKMLPEWMARDATALARFEREAQTLASVNHPNIATIFSLEESGGLHFLTMELVPGATLAERIASGPLGLEVTLAIARQIAKALEAAHAREIVHRDLKPLNIALTPEGRVKVLDFGIAKASPQSAADAASAASADDTMAATQAGPGSGGAGLTATGLVLGSPGYMSPEQLRQRSVDHRTDIWSFGCVLYECLTGEAAFPGEVSAERIAATLERTPDLAALPPEVPDGIRDLLLRCLEKDPARRLDSIARARETLETEIAHRTHPGMRPQVLPKTAPHRNNLPAQLASFVGRERELQEVRGSLHENRLVTLTGSGGCGKTRLALEVASLLLGECADGVWLAEMAPLADPALVVQAVATAVGTKEERNRPPLQTLAKDLTDKKLLLVLDSCEHVLAACTTLADTLLRAAPSLRILATSREAMGMTGEAVYQVPCLAVPDPIATGRAPETHGTGPVRPAAGTGPSPTGPRSGPVHVPASTLAKLRETESVRLFVERAAGVSTGFALSEANAAAIVQICRRLDGIPLAIELAAARVRALPVEEIARRLDDRFRLLTVGSKTSLPRHQALRALIDWSYDHLTEAEQAVLRRLSVHAGGWTLDDAEAICSGDGIEDWEVLDLLSRLVDKSLVEREREAGVDRARYRMLETVRQYAFDRLREKTEEPAVRRRHRDWFLGLAERAEPQLTGPEQTVWLARLESEHDNLRAALAACAGDAPDAEVALRLVGALGRYWMLRGHWSEARGLYTQILASPDAQTRTVARAKVLNWAGSLETHQGDYAEARQLFEESLAIHREVGDRGGIARALESLGRLSEKQGDPEQAEAQYRDSLAIFREIGDRWGLAAILNTLGSSAGGRGDYARAHEFFKESLAIRRELGAGRAIVASLNSLGRVACWQRDFARARAFFEEGVPILRELGDRWGVAGLLNNLGEVSAKQGDTAQSRTYLDESLQIYRDLGDRAGIGNALFNLGLVFRSLGDTDAARPHLEESLAIFAQLGDRRGIADLLQAMATLAGASGQPAQSARLLGAAESLREAIRAAWSADERQDLEPELAALRTTLGEAAFARHWSDGRALSPEQAVALALGTPPNA